MAKNSYAEGFQAETQVKNLYEKEGWLFLCRNYRGVGFEIDLIFYRNSMIAFVEVKKIRCTHTIEQLWMSKKKKSLKKGADTFLTDSRFSLPSNAIHYRFDLVILKNHLEYEVFENISIE